MLVKIDTKAHFKVLEVIPREIHANMAEELKAVLDPEKAVPPRDIILDWKNVQHIEAPVIAALDKIQSDYEARKISLVMTGFGPGLTAIKKTPAFERLHTAPTLREAIDLVMMEKLERELLDPEA